MKRVVTYDVMLDGHYKGTVKYQYGLSEVVGFNHGNPEAFVNEAALRKLVVDKFPILRGKNFETVETNQRVSSWRW